MKQFTYKKVADHFKESEEYRTRKGIVHDKEDPIIISFIRSNASSEDKILEVRGGSGAFLDLVLENTSIKETYNVELVFETYKKQVNENICLIGGNALDLPFKDCSFERVVIKNLLHHLVGRTRRESKAFTKRAVEELIRVTKDGGYIIILDQYNRHRFFSSVIFYLTLFFSVFGINFKSFGWGKNVIVSFLTPDEIKNLLTGAGNVEIVLSMENRLDVSRKWKYTLLMSDIGRLLVVGRIHKFKTRLEANTPIGGGMSSARHNDIKFAKEGQTIGIKICLVNPGKLSKNQPPLSLAYLAAYLRKYGRHNYEIEIADENAGGNIFKVIKNFKPHIVGITATTFQIARASEIASYTKKIDKRILTIIGGVHVTALPELTLRTTDFDIGVIREGEETFRELVDMYISKEGVFCLEDLRTIKGIAYKRDGNFFINEERGFIENLDNIPLPARNLLDMDFYLKPRIVIKGLPPLSTSTIITARGCPYDCIYCGNPYLYKKKVRFHSPERMISEIEDLVREYNVKSFYFVDDILTLNKKRIRRFCELLIEKGLSKSIIWSCQGRANLVTEKDLELYMLMKKAGCIQLEFGFESGSERVLGFLKNHSVTVSQNQVAINIIKKVGMRIIGYFMIGTASETKEEMLETQDFINKNLNELDYFSIGYTTPYPGTKLWDIYGIDKNATEKIWKGYVPYFKFRDFIKILKSFNSMEDINLEAAREIEMHINSLAFTHLSFRYKINRVLPWLRQNPKALIIMIFDFLKQKFR